MKSRRIAAFPGILACAVVAAAVFLAAARAPAADAPAPGAPKESKDNQPAAAGDAKPPTTAPANPTTAPARPKFVLKYRPVVTETSSRREVGLARAGRGAEEKDPPAVHVLAPDGAGTTTREQPTLYWYISEPTRRKVRLSLTPLNDKGAGPRFPKPALSVELNGVEKPGIQAFALSNAKGADGSPVKLEKGGRYRWVVIVVMSDTERAKNPYAGCTVSRVDAPASLTAASAEGAQAAAAYAEAGVWYDALAALQHAIESDPNDTVLRAARRELLASQKLVEDEKGNIRDAASQK
jgi:hypothetical protein